MKSSGNTVFLLYVNGLGTGCIDW